MPVVLIMRIRNTAKTWMGTLYVPDLPVDPHAGFVFSSCRRCSSARRTSMDRCFRSIIVSEFVHFWNVKIHHRKSSVKCTRFASRTARKAIHLRILVRVLIEIVMFGIFRQDITVPLPPCSMNGEMTDLQWTSFYSAADEQHVFHSLHSLTLPWSDTGSTQTPFASRPVTCTTSTTWSIGGFSLSYLYTSKSTTSVTMCQHWTIIQGQLELLSMV